MQFQLIQTEELFFLAIYRCFIRRGAHSKHDQDEVIMDNASKSKMPGSYS